MSQNDGLNRRSFLKNAGLTALVGAVAPGSSLVAAAGAALVPAADNTKFDFDTPYSRIGTDSTKWDGPINTGLTDKDHIVAGMGIADMDFRAAPAIAQALQERMKHEVLSALSITFLSRLRRAHAVPVVKPSKYLALVRDSPAWRQASSWSSTHPQSGVARGPIVVSGTGPGSFTGRGHTKTPGFCSGRGGFGASVRRL